MLRDYYNLSFKFDINKLYFMVYLQFDLLIFLFIFFLLFQRDHYNVSLNFFFIYIFSLNRIYLHDVF
jgi:hypothetical protein